LIVCQVPSRLIIFTPNSPVSMGVPSLKNRISCSFIPLFGRADRVQFTPSGDVYIPVKSLKACVKYSPVGDFLTFTRLKSPGTFTSSKTICPCKGAKRQNATVKKRSLMAFGFRCGKVQLHQEDGQLL